MINMNFSNLINKISKDINRANSFSNDLQIGVFEENPQKEYIDHAHDFSEIAIVKSGSAMHFIDGKAHHIAKGNVIFINHPDVHHTFTSNKNLEITNIAYDNDEYSLKSLFGTNSYENKFNRNLFLLDTTGFDNVTNIARKLSVEIDGQNSLNEVYVKSFLTQLFIEILRSTEEKPNNGINSRDDIARYFISYINNNFQEEVDWEYLCSYFDISFRTLSRIINQHTGYSPHHLLVLTRMCHATHYLSNLQLSVSEISSLCGFQDSNHFSYTFRKHFDLSPIAYRTKLTN